MSRPIVAIRSFCALFGIPVSSLKKGRLGRCERCPPCRQSCSLHPGCARLSSIALTRALMSPRVRAGRNTKAGMCPLLIDLGARQLV